jgi:hypothetical protein
MTDERRRGATGYTDRISEHGGPELENSHFVTQNSPLRRLVLVAAILAILMRADEQAARADDFSGMRGANYVPSYARNDVQTWMDYDPAVIDRELGYAERLRLNTVRVFLQVAVYERDPKLFLTRFEDFLARCEKHHLAMMPVVFDSCFGEFPDLENCRKKDWMAHSRGPLAAERGDLPGFEAEADLAGADLDLADLRRRLAEQVGFSDVGGRPRQAKRDVGGLARRFVDAKLPLRGLAVGRVHQPHGREHDVGRRHLDQGAGIVGQAFQPAAG